MPDGSTVGEVAKELGRRWGELGDEEKSKYQKNAEVNKAQYEKDMEAYNNGLYGKCLNLSLQFINQKNQKNELATNRVPMDLMTTKQQQETAFNNYNTITTPLYSE